ncbi:FHA domain-containing protein [Nannocystis sp.]|uniref:FHA domain-containing protein n=1 Tax=Nannocystis sp. TaxID=1962667 RepID=UPI0025FA77ED|nr:FHA domain-containing protein [Nannocystis sp.]MBK7830592.1 FHA domain-containing protein [Nannocystis sp.]
MSEWIPCPACGSESGPEASACVVCGYRLDDPKRDPGPGKCARCGSALGEAFEFCQICGLGVHSRLPRPQTESLRLVPPRPRGKAKKTPTVPPPPSPEVVGFSPGLRPGSSAEDGASAASAASAGAAPGAPLSREWSPPVAPLPALVSVAPGVVGASPMPRRAPGANKLRLVVVQRDGSEGEVIPLGDTPLFIGRWQGDLRFPADEFLGPSHARVDPQAKGVLVADLGTRNGVFVRISRPEPVFPGDLFLLGHQLLRLENIPEAGREGAPAADGVRGFGTPLQPAWGRLVLLGPGGVEAESHYLRHPQVVFGRELGDIVFPADPFVSWQHAQITMEASGPDTPVSVTLTDLRSANGTYLRARGDVILDPGDMFRVGDQIFRVRMH